MFKDQLTQTPCCGQGCLSLDCIAQGPSKLILNISSNGEPMTSLDSMFQYLHHSHSKKFLPYIQPKSTLFHFNFHFVLSLHVLQKIFLNLFFFPCNILKGWSMFFPNSSCVHDEQQQFCQPIFTREGLQPSDNFGGSSLVLL